MVCIACSKTIAHLHEAAPPILSPGWITLQSPDTVVSIGIPPTFHSALDKAPAPQLSMEQQQEPPAPDETGGDPSLAAPPSSASQTDQDADQAVKRFVGDLNSFSAQMEEAQHEEVVKHMKKDNLVVWAWLNGKANLTESMTQISVKKLRNVGAISLDDAANAAKEGMPGGVRVVKVTLPIGEARIAKSSFQNRIGDEQTEIIYVLLDGGDEYLVRFAATNGKEQIEPIADPVMQTLRIKQKA